MNLENTFLDIKIFFNPQAIICNTKDKEFCQEAKQFFNIPIIINKNKFDRILIIENERLWCLLAL